MLILFHLSTVDTELPIHPLSTGSPSPPPVSAHHHNGGLSLHSNHHPQTGHHSSAANGISHHQQHPQHQHAGSSAALHHGQPGHHTGRAALLHNILSAAALGQHALRPYSTGSTGEIIIMIINGSLSKGRSMAREPPQRNDSFTLVVYHSNYQYYLSPYLLHLFFIRRAHLIWKLSIVNYHIFISLE